MSAGRKVDRLMGREEKREKRFFRCSFGKLHTGVKRKKPFFPKKSGEGLGWTGHPVGAARKKK